MSLKIFLKKIGLFFEGLFNAAAKAYNELAPEVQAALVKGSEILNIINDNLDKHASVIVALIQTKFPDVDLVDLETGLKKVSDGLNIADKIVDDTLESTIDNLIVYLDSKDGVDWASVASFAAKLLSAAFAPDGTKWAIFESLMEFVYQKFIKK